MELGDLERLNAVYDLSVFDAGQADLGGQAVWLRDRGLTNEKRGLTRVFVATYPGSRRVAAFFGIAPGSIVPQGLPRRLRPHGTPPVIPAWFVARLAVDERLQGRGVGRDILLAALSRIIQAQEAGGGALVVVDAASDTARHLYSRYRFVPLAQVGASAQTMRMVAPMGEVVDLFRPL